MSKLAPRGCLYNTWLTFIPEWVCCGVKFIQHSHDKTDRLSLRNNNNILAHMVFMPYRICMCNLHQTKWFVIFKLEQSLFQLTLKPEWNFIPDQEFHLDWQPAWTHCRMTCMRTNVISVSCQQIQRNKWSWKFILVSCK